MTSSARTAFLPLPGRDDPRPVLAVVVEHLEHVPLYCLVDTGSLRTRLPAWIAEAAGLDLSAAATERIAVGGMTYLARFDHVQLRTHYGVVTCGAWFCDGW